MEPATRANLIEQGAKLLGDGIRVLMSRPSQKADSVSKSKESAAQLEALGKLGPHTVVTLHDNGDAVVKVNNELYIVTTSGNVFKQHNPSAVPDSSSRQSSPAVRYSAQESSSLPDSPPENIPKAQKINLPTAEETTQELKRRLARELYRAEMDLVAGLKIAGKPCDCLDVKHSLFIEAAAEELVSQDPGNHVYLEIIDWIKKNQPKVTVSAIQSGKYAEEYPRMANAFKEFRKRVVGTASVSPTKKPGTVLSLEDAKQMASEQAAKEVERAWNSAEKQ